MMNKERFEKAAEEMRVFLADDVVSRIKEANEAKTRLLIVNKVLEILGWPREDFNPEESTSAGGYTDYLLTIEGQPRLIVEAKRIGLVEPIPQNLQRPEYSNRFLYKNCGTEMRLLLQQCRDYCTDRGLPYALATTGEVWVVLIGFKFGVEWGKLKSFVFHSLEDIAQNFHKFYGLLSREAVKNNSLEEEFGSLVIVKPRVAIRPHEHVRANTELTSVHHRQVIHAFFDQFMSDITHRSEMLKQCYVSSARLTEYSRELKQLLDHDVAFEEQETVPEEVDKEKLEQEVELQLASSSPKTILLVGNIGAGKSTFIHRFALLEAQDKQHACVVLDLINEVSRQIEEGNQEEQKISTLILEEIEKKFHKKVDPYDPDTLRGCFEVELGRFKRQQPKLYTSRPEEYELREEEYLHQLTENSYRHLVGYIRYVRKKGYKPWVAFDNVDQGSASYQEFAYAFAHKLASDARCVTLITLREDTFLEAQEAGFLNVRSSDIVFKLRPPELGQVISKRRKYVDKLLERNRLPKVFRAYKNLILMLNWHITRLVLDESDAIRVMIATFSLNNVRFALTILRDYYLSHHSTFHDFYRDYERAEAELNSIGFNDEHEHDRFLQALMLDGGWSYREHRSGIFNLFSVDRLEKTSHFLVLRVLAYLSLDKNGTAARNVVKCKKVIKDFVFLGYHRRHINTGLRRLLQFGLVVSPNLRASFTTKDKLDIPDPLPPEAKLLLTPKGYHYLTELVRNQYYQTRVGEDTIWYDDELAQLYITCLEDSVENQKSFGKDDALVATDARDFFMQYLRKSLVQEDQVGGIRSTSQEWSRLVNDLVERNLFGEQITESVYLPDTDAKLDRMTEHTTDQHVLRRRPKSIFKMVDPNQMSLFGHVQNYETAISDAIDSLGELPAGIKFQNSRYILRVLWVLEIAARAGLGALRASNIAELICEYTDDSVAAPNVARFFRNQKKTGKFIHLWDESPEKHYSISSVGRTVLASILDEH